MSDPGPIVSPWADAPERSRRRRLDKRAAILRAAAREFADRGFTGASLDDIASALGISKPTIYYHVGDKDALYYACFMAAFDELTEERARFASREIGARTMLRVWVESYIAGVTGEFGYCLVMTELKRLGDETRKKIEKLYARDITTLRAILQRGQREGEFHPPGIDAAISIIAGALNWIPRWYDGRKHDPRRIADRFMESFELMLQIEDRTLRAKRATRRKARSGR